MEDITVGSLGNEHELVCASYLHHCGGVDKKAYTMETMYSSMKEKTTRHSTFDGQPLKPCQEGLHFSSTSHCGPSLLTAINSSSLWVPPLHPDPAIVHCEFLCSKSITTTDMQDDDSWIV
jgi:hypothetical protein